MIARLTGVIKRSTQKIKDFNKLFEHKVLLSQTSILEILEQVSKTKFEVYQI